MKQKVFNNKKDTDDDDEFYRGQDDDGEDNMGEQYRQFQGFKKKATTRKLATSNNQSLIPSNAPTPTNNAANDYFEPLD